MPEGYGMGAFQTALNFVSDVGQQFVGHEFWQKRFDESLQGQKELYEYAHDYTAEMNRLAKAGLNPNLIYGNISGSSPMPSAPSVGGSSSNFTTADIAQTAANLSHSKALDADASLKNAEAGYWNKVSNRYDEVIAMALRKEEQEIQTLAHQLDVGNADIRYKDSLITLNNAQQQFIRGEIDLQHYKQLNLAAQTILYKSQSKNYDSSTELLKNQAAIAELESLYLELFYSDGRMKELSDAEYNAAKNKFSYEASRVAARESIEGSKVTQWIDWLLGEFGQIMGGARDVSTAHRNFHPKR